MPNDENKPEIKITADLKNIKIKGALKTIEPDNVGYAINAMAQMDISSMPQMDSLSKNWNHTLKSYANNQIDESSFESKKVEISKTLSAAVNDLEEDKQLDLDSKITSEKSDLFDFKLEESEKLKILFLASNPSQLGELSLRVEHSRIAERLQNVDEELFDIKVNFATTSRQFIDRVIDYKPHILHFSGHGIKGNQVKDELADRLDKALDGRGGIAFIHPDKPGEHKILAARSLRKIIERMLNAGKVPLKAVILNACYSEEEAKQISTHNLYAIGMEKAIADNTSVSFSSSFYEELCRARNIKKALNTSLMYMLTNDEDIDKNVKLFFEEKELSLAVDPTIPDIQYGSTPTDAGSKEKESFNLILNHLEKTYITAKAQSKLRKELIRNLSDRLDIPNETNFYDSVSQYYTQFIPFEKQRHNIIRGYTKDILAPNNSKVLELLLGQPELKKCGS